MKEVKAEMMKSFREKRRFSQISAEEEMSDREKNGGFWERKTGLTGCEPTGCLQLQFLDLFDQQGDVLQQVGVLLEQPLHSGLGAGPSVQLQRQLLLENVDLSRTACMCDQSK